MGTITDPKLWTAETPNLYVLVVSLYRDLESAEKGQGALDVETCRVGIRDVQFAGEGAQMTYLYFGPLGCTFQMFYIVQYLPSLQQFTRIAVCSFLPCYPSSVSSIV